MMLTSHKVGGLTLMDKYRLGQPSQSQVIAYKINIESILSTYW